MKTIFNAQTRQKAEPLFVLNDPLSAAESYVFPVRMISGFSIIDFLAITSGLFDIVVEQGNSPDGPWIETSTLSSTIDTATGYRVVVQRVEPIGSHMRVTVNNMAGAEVFMEFLGQGLAIAGSTAGTGAQGAQGAQGSGGPAGAQGAQGPAGAGAQGAQGAQGVAGPQGATGTAGAQGAQGANGAAGAQGAQGSAGAQGAVGAQGAQGSSGGAGAQGAQGPIGAQGSVGAQGAAGPQGAQGSAGAQGAQGNDGTSAGRVYLFASPDVLTTTDNASIPWLPGQGDAVDFFQCSVKTAPTGASLIVLFKLVTLATGVVGSTVATVTITAGNFYSSTTLGTPITVQTTQALAMEISQVGSTVPGSSLTGTAQGTAPQVPIYAFSESDTLTTTDNATIPWVPGQGTPISLFTCAVKTAPTGASLIVLFKRVDMTTGVVGATVATVTMTAGTFLATTTLGSPVTIATNEALAMEISQVGSTVAGASLTGTAQ